MSELLLRRRNLLMRKQEEMNIRAVCFKADGEQTVELVKHNYTSSKVFQYSYDGKTWESWDMSPLQFGGSTKLYVRGYNKTLGWDKDTYTNFVFGTDAFVYVSGVVESLLDGDNEVLTYGTRGILLQLFYQQTALRSAENLRFEAMSNSENCYQAMFSGCSNLLSAPELPATKLGYAPYRSMFNGCANLIKAPSILPAITIGTWAYASMFNGCTSLVNAPKLPATTLASQCYQNMFRNCSSLVNAPELPATTLSAQCYQNMFYGCTSIKTIRCHAKVTASSATTYWLYGISSSGTFYGHSEYGWATGVSGIPSGWEFVELTD